MRWPSITSFCIALLAIGAAGSAGAATLDFTGTLRLQLSTWPHLSTDGALSVSATGSALVNGSATGIHLNSLILLGGTFGPITTSLPRLPHPTTGFASMWFTGIENLNGSFAGLSGSSSGGGTMGVSGFAKLCLFAPAACAFSYVPFPLTPTAGGAALGIGGTRTTTHHGVAITMQHAFWTLGQPVMTIHTPSSNVTSPVLPGGFAHGAASLTSSTAQPPAVVQLVTVTKVFTSLPAAFPELPIIGVLTLHFAPEPGNLLLLVSGAVPVAFLAWRRRKS